MQLCRSSHADEGPDDLSGLTRALFDEPPLAVVRALDVGLLVPGPDHVEAVATLVGIVGVAPAASSLRELGIGVVDRWGFGLRRDGGYLIGDVSELGERFPRLERLTLAAVRPRAERGLRLPSLTTLSLESPTGLGRLLRALEAPRLRHLALVRTDDTDDLVEQLASSLPGHLEVLELPSGALTDEGALTLAEAAARSRTLRRVDVTRNLLGPTGLDALHRAGVTTVGDRTQRTRDPEAEDDGDEDP